MVQGTNSAAQAMMARIDDLISARGESVETMSEIGELLRELVADPDFHTDLGEETFDMGIATKQILARGGEESMLAVHDFNAPWVIQETAAVHFHHYWQVLLLAQGEWQDTIWAPIDETKEVTLESIRIARRDVMHAGDVQILDPTEPHGWEANEPRTADDALMLVWTGDHQGKTHTVIDLATGALSQAEPRRGE
jgi:predicted metal-dependent enzyme (double-stranded beta helix superfamily)